MAIRPYLALTAAEFGGCDVLPDRCAWLACHFSPYSDGLSNLPDTLPPESLLVLSDMIPIHRHDPGRIACQLNEIRASLGCSGILLDFQRPDTSDTAVMARELTQRLGGSVAVSALCAGELDCPVLLPPCPLHCTLEEHIAPWQGRTLWLEAALNAGIICLRHDGARYSDLPPGPNPEGGHQDRALCCRYRISLEPEEARFTLWREAEELRHLLDRAETLGVTEAVGLLQELGSAFSVK